MPPGCTRNVCSNGLQGSSKRKQDKPSGISIESKFFSSVLSCRILPCFSVAGQIVVFVGLVKDYFTAFQSELMHIGSAKLVMKNGQVPACIAVGATAVLICLMKESGEEKDAKALFPVKILYRDVLNIHFPVGFVP